MLTQRMALLLVGCCLTFPAPAGAQVTGPTDTYRHLKARLDTVPAIDTHDHFWPFDRLPGYVETEHGKGMNLAVPRLVGHRGLLHHAPENTLAGFAACLDLRVGFELDIRRTRDGHLVCLHDEDVKRTTNGTGKVSALSLAELRKLDAGARFDPAFAGERVPTLEEVFALLQERQAKQVLVALDLKIDDPTVEADMVRLAVKHGVLGQVVCIGRAISEPAVRRKLRATDPKTPVAMLAQTAEELPQALTDRDSDWICVRFLPTPDQVAQIHGAGKRVFLVGPLVSGHEPGNWRRAREASVDALLTDFPLECRQLWRAAAAP